MKTSIFKKLFKTYAITLIIGFGLLAVLLSQLFNHYFITKKKELLIEQGQKISEEIAIGLYTGIIDDASLQANLSILDRYLNAHIWLVDRTGKIYGVSGEEEKKYLGQRIEKAQIEELYQGKVIIAQGSFGGKFAEPVLTVGYPMIFRRELRGGVLIHASLPEIQRSFHDIYRITLWAIIISIGIAYCVLYVQTKKISKHLMEINEAAKVISSGEFQKRLHIDTEDEIEELAKSFNEMAESLEKIEEMRKNFIANISHDLRSPMTTIRGFVEGIVDGTIPEEMQEHYLRIVLEESKRLIKMTNDLLDLSKMQQGQVQLHKTAFELHELLRRQLISFEQRITQKNIQVELILFQQTAKVLADQTYVERILFNLIDNAVKFTPEGEKITIQTLEHKDKVWVEMINTGTSMNPEELKNAWERFQKGDASRGKDPGGFGLGLAIVREMIRQHDEKIWVQSKDGAEVKFTFTLHYARGC